MARRATEREVCIMLGSKVGNSCLTALSDRKRVARRGRDNGGEHPKARDSEKFSRQSGNFGAVCPAGHPFSILLLDHCSHGQSSSIHLPSTGT